MVDQATKDYIEHLRRRRVNRAFKCDDCLKEPVGINSNGYHIKFVCEDHLEEDLDA
jgi:hypothetical protein